MKMIGKAVAATLALALLGSGVAHAAGMGLKTRWAEVTVDHLKIGKTYSMAELLNFPLRIVNTSEGPVELRVDVITPQPDEVVKGYEAIPDASWVRLQQSTFTVGAGQEAVSDVILSIPLDDKYLGRRFQVFLWTQTQNIGSLGVGLKSRLLISVSSTRPTDEELAKKFVGKRLANVNFSLAPMEMVVEDVPVGQVVNLEKDKGAKLRLLNPNDDALSFKLTSVGVWETPLSLVRGYEAPSDPKWLMVATKDQPEPSPAGAPMKAAAESINPVRLSLSIPAGEAYMGRSYMFVLRAEILEQEISAYGYVRVFVKTKGKGS